MGRAQSANEGSDARRTRLGPRHIFPAGNTEHGGQHNMCGNAHTFQRAHVGAKHRAVLGWFVRSSGGPESPIGFWGSVQ